MVVRRHKGGLLRILWGTWDDFWQETSISGASNAGKAQGLPYIRRLCWMAIFATFFALTIFNVAKQFVEFYHYPVNYEVYVTHKDQVPFPSVTVCNQNRVHCGNLKTTIDDCMANMNNCWNQESILNTLQYFYTACDASKEYDQKDAAGEGQANQEANDQDQTQVSSSPKQRNKRKASKDESIKPEDMGDVAPNTEAENDFLYKYSSIATPLRAKIGHKFYDFIQSCSFRGRDCLDISYFRFTNDMSYGNCFTFNTEENDDDPFAGVRKSSMTGPFFGLSLILNLEQRYYVGNGITQAAGARIGVHNVTGQPLMSERGYDLMPNTQTNLAIQEVNITRLPSPYPSSCMSDFSETNYTDYVTNMKNVTWPYSLLQCKRACSFSQILIECGCYHPIFLETDAQADWRTCDLSSNSTDYACVEMIMTELDQQNRLCNCNVSCGDIDYELYLSNAKWPSKQYEDTAASLYGYQNVPSDVPGLSDNLLQVNVYFKTLNVKRVGETAVYDSLFGSSFVAALGGALSLFLGISLSMVFEVFEFIIDLLLNLGVYCAKGSYAHDNEGEIQKNNLRPWSKGFEYNTPPKVAPTE